MFPPSKTTFSSWAKYLVGLAFLLGAGFFCSGLISWVAANWYGFSHDEKFYGAQVLFILSLAASLLYYHSPNKRHQALPSQVALFISAISMGGLFALIGQIYQTGADNWQLFALWAVFQSILLFAAPNIANAWLFLITIMTAFFLWLDAEYSWGQTLSLYIFIAVSLLSVMMTELGKNFFNDQRWRILIRFSALILIISMLLLEFDLLSSTSRWHSLLNITIALALSWFYSRKIADIVIVALNILLLIIIAAIESTHFLWDVLGNSTLSYIIIGLIVLAIGVRLVLFFHHLFIQNNPNYSASVFIQKLSGTATHSQTQPNMHWALQAILFIAVLIASFAFVVANMFIWGSTDETMSIVNNSQGVIFCLIAWYLYRYSIKTSEAQKYSFSQTIAQAFIIVGLSIMLSSEFFAYEESLHRHLALLLSIITFWLIPLFLARTVCVLSILSCIFLYIGPYLMPDLYGMSISALISGHYIFLIFVFVLVVAYRLIHKPSAMLWPILWGSLLFIALDAVLFSSTSVLYQSPFVVSQSTHPLSVWEQMTGDLYSHIDWTHSILYFWACSPAIMGFFLSKNLPLIGKVVVVLVLLCLGSMWIYYPSLLLSINLLLCVYGLQHKGLFALTVSAVIAQLSFLYYSLDVSLLAKSYFLLVTGSVLLMVGLFTFQQTSNCSLLRLSFHFHHKRFLTSLGVSLVATLGFANYLVHHYENILQNGQNIILKLAPVDPRSLMQGDYMALDFEVLNKASLEASKYIGKGIHIERNILLSVDEKGVAHFCSLNQTSTTQCPLSIKVNFLEHGARLVESQHYFFPEGNREYFAQARYAEFRQGKDGTLLIKQLLDKDLHPLSKVPPITD